MVNFRKKLNGAFALRPQNEIDPLQGRRRGSSYCRRIIEFQYYQEGKFSFEMIVKDLIYIEKKKILSEGHFFLVTGTIWIASLSSQCRKCRNEHFETERIKGFLRCGEPNIKKRDFWKFYHQQITALNTEMNVWISSRYT